MAEVHDAVLSGAVPPVAPRTLVSESWRRSLAGGVDPETDQPPYVYTGDALAELREGHPLAGVLPTLRDTLVSIADEAVHLMIVTDADGHILWREGSNEVRVRADQVGLAEGTRWAEEVIGTNAMGTTLAIGRPVTIHSAEHLVRTYHAWTCAAAPVYDPDTGVLLGAVDITGPTRTRHPATLALVTAAAQLAESQLRVRMTARDERLRQRNLPHLLALGGSAGALLTPTGRVLAAQSCGDLPPRVDVRADAIALPDGREARLEPLDEGYLLRLSRPARRQRATLRLDFLGATHPVATVDGRAQPLSARHADILTLLALHPRGMSAEQLAVALHGDTGNPVTARAEMHRLRATLGDHVVLTRPYRIAATVTADFLRLPDLLRTGRLREAATHGELLPRSQSPAVADHRAELHATLRRTLLDRGDTEDLWTYVNNPLGTDDIEIHETLADLLPWDDARLPMVRARIDHRGG